MAHSDRNFKVNPDLTNDKFTKKFNKHNSGKKHFAKKHYDEEKNSFYNEPHIWYKQ